MNLGTILLQSETLDKKEYQLASDLTGFEYTSQLVNNILMGKQITSGLNNEIPNFIKDNVSRISDIIQKDSLLFKLKLLIKHEKEDKRIFEFEKLREVISQIKN